MKTFVELLLFFFVICLCGCGTVCDLSSFNFSPRMRIGFVPSRSLLTRFPEPDALGIHSYGHSLWERNGVVYTCRGGHIDLVHLRGSADWTAYLAGRVYECISAAEENFSFKLTEPSVYTVSFEYPGEWVGLSIEQREAAASEAAVELGQYLSYVAGVWHEILTWYGFKWTGVFNEQQSAFSWEDMYSNAVGISIAGEALRNWPGEPFGETITGLIDEELSLLCVQPARVARETAAAVREKWYLQPYISGEMNARNFDIGLDDGFISPRIIPSELGCDRQSPAKWPIASNDLSKYGIKATVRIDLREWERHEILKAAYQREDPPVEYIDPAIHFGNILADIIGQAETEYAADM